MEKLLEYDGPDVIACKCRQNKEYSTMFKCDICDRYSHDECYGLSEDDVEQPFTCDYCVGKAIMDEIPSQDFEEVNEEPQGINYMKKAHKYHAGIVSMRIILKDVKWKGKDAAIINFVKKCSVCIEKNIPKQTKMSFRMPERVNQYVGIDLMEYTWENEEYKYIVVMRDMLSGMLHLTPVIGKTASQVLNPFIQYCSKFGLPETVVMDEGTEFSGEFKAFLDKEEIIVEKSTPYVKKENGLSERAIKYVRSLLRVVQKVYPNADAERQVRLAELYRNHKPRQGTGYKAIKMMTLLGNKLGPKQLELGQEIRTEATIKLGNLKQKQLESSNIVIVAYLDLEGPATIF